LSRSEDEILDYIIRRSLEDGEIQEPMSEIASAIGMSRATVWRSLHKLEKRGVIEIIETPANREPNKIRLVDSTKNDLEIFEEWITDGEEMVKEAQQNLENLRRNKELIMDLKNQMRKYRDRELRELKSINFGENYELVVRRKKGADTSGDKELAVAFGQVLKKNLNDIMSSVKDD